MKFKYTTTTHGSRHSYISELIEQGYEKLGSGVYATALAHPKRPSRVIKVGAICRDRDPYLFYLKMANGMNSPHTPRINSVRVFRDKETQKASFYVVEMERLYPAQHDRRLLDSICERQFGITHGELAQLDSLFYRKSLIERGTKSSLRPFLPIISKLATISSIDLHNENVMYRRERGRTTLVITDPAF